MFASFAAPAFAQTRNFPATALRGTITVRDPSDVTLNRKPAQLSPGARIRGQNNLLLVWGVVVGEQMVVNYTTDNNGMVQDIWVLTPAEADKWPWPRTVAESQKWSFDPVAQVWTKP